MSLSPERQTHLAHIVVDGIWNDDLVDYTDEDEAVRVGKKAVFQFAKDIADMDSAVKQKIATLKRNVVEGSPEYDVMYSKYLDEEMSKRGNK
jgi:hypothetical protein